LLALCLLASSSLAGAALASDGRREISQAGILAAGGYPFVITQPGSYVLTSDLTPAANVIGIRIDTDDVQIDLNGFAIRSSLVCVPGSCTGTGPSQAIAASPTNTATGRRCTVRNGTIKGVNGVAVELRDDALVEGLSVSNTFHNGIVLGPRSLARGNRISAIGRAGLVLGAESGFAENVIADTGQFFTFGSVTGGKQVGRNACDDGRCPPRRRYYLTLATGPGSTPKTACDPGFHFAQISELTDPSQLEYFQFANARPVANGSPGPPHPQFGWVRAGSVLAQYDCNNWIVGDNSGEGLFMNWDPFGNSVGGGAFGTGWNLVQGSCVTSLGAWCVED